MDALKITYRFIYEHDKTHQYSLQLNPQTLEIISSSGLTNSTWGKLEFNQCPNCPLDSTSSPICPVANNLGMLVNNSNELQSHNQVYLEVITNERVVSADTTVQRGLSSLLGLILATSDCPHTRFFRPMARFHLPLASEEETTYRAASMYMLAQYFRANEGKPADIELAGLADIYQQLQMVNQALGKRLRAASDSDATVNAVVLLDLLAKTLPHSITDMLQELRHLYSAYLDT